MTTEYKYNCKTCNYYTNNRSGYYQHTRTKKHMKCNSNVTPKSSQSNSKVTRNLQCLKCKYIFKYRQGLWNHKKRNNCKSVIPIVINNINNGTINNIENKIIFNINSIEDVQKIKEELLKINFNNLCKSDKKGIVLKSSDVINNLQDFSIEMKKENPELQYFKKTNINDNILDIFKDNRFKKTFFDKYNRNDLLKISKVLLEICNKNKIYDETLNYICDILSEYEYYNNLNEEDKHGVDIVLKAIKECEKKSKLEHYNITKIKKISF